eukprot:scaffold130949_cov66-Phaeocystis_antarctica.AAC.1
MLLLRSLEGICLGVARLRSRPRSRFRSRSGRGGRSVQARRRGVTRGGRGGGPAVEAAGRPSSGADC